MRTRTAVAALVGGVLLLLAAVAGFSVSSPDRSGGAAPEDAARSPADPLTAAISKAQRRLSDVPGDYTTWAALGSAYVEQARLTADPSYYDRADGALHQSLTLRSDGNVAALAGLGALANARHDFAAAAALALQAVDIDPYSASAWGVLTDARTQLGDYAGATDAVHRMLDLQPGVPSFTRASYDAELHGNLPGARAALEQALGIARTPADEAFCRAYLAALAFSAGDLAEAAAQTAAGLTAVPGEPTLLLGRARLLAAQGQVDDALSTYRAVVDARPLPGNLVEYGEYLESLGRADQAQEQFAVLDTVGRLFAASGVQDDLSTALFAADHGDPATAVPAAQAEYGRRQNIDAQDALAWALHSAGRDAEALPLAQQAASLGGATASFLYHRGVIEAGLGMVEAARATLQQALDTNPYFSPLQAPRAAELLASLGGRP
jgi:tetratricopeptide (TPR) repeat protein